MAQSLEMIDEEECYKCKRLRRNRASHKARRIDVERVYRQMFHDKKIKGSSLHLFFQGRV